MVFSTSIYRDLGERHLETHAPVSRRVSRNKDVYSAKRYVQSPGHNNRRLSFVEQRDNLDKKGNGIYYRYSRRKEHQFGKDIRATKTEHRCLDGCIEPFMINDPQRLSLRKMIKAMFTEKGAQLAFDPEEIMTFQSLYQVINGSCTFASLLTCLHLSGLDNLIPLPGWTEAHTFVTSKGKPAKIITDKTKMYWEQVWWPKLGIERARDSGEMMEILQRSSILSAKQQQELFERARYIPIRSNGHNESMYNSEFWNPEETMKRFNLSREAYDNEQPIVEIGNLIEKLIDMGHPMMLGMDGHNTVIVGYNGTRLLCAGSWSDEMIRSYDSNKDKVKMFADDHTKFDNLHKMTQMDVYYAGFHNQDKHMVWNSVRDLLYFV